MSPKGRTQNIKNKLYREHEKEKPLFCGIGVCQDSCHKNPEKMYRF